MNVNLSPEVQQAKAENRPIVALESTVISHGLPYPENIKLASELENIIREQGAVPATIGITKGVVQVGLSSDDLEQLANGKTEVRKLSRRDLGAAIAKKQMGATTVAATMLVAHHAGIQLFATGGIGGVHRGDGSDVSADLIEFSQTPVAVVCAGAKSILDLPRTLEWLETFGVPVLGYQTQQFPAFYTRDSGLEVVDCVDSPEEAAAILQAHWGFGLQNGVLITVPIPEEDALAPEFIGSAIEQALQEAAAQHITGKDITPYLLSALVRLTDGKSLQANLALLRNNARVAAQIASAIGQQS